MTAKPATAEDALTLGCAGRAAVEGLLARFGLKLALVGPGEKIPGSYWGEPEAGVVGLSVFARADTPVHSVLHEACHVICMDEARRRRLHTDAGGDDLEEAAVCYLQILLADHLAGVGARRLMRDMDAWGYSFRLGSTRRWFETDACDALAWLLTHGLADALGRPAWRCRGAGEKPRLSTG